MHFADPKREQCLWKGTYYENNTFPGIWGAVLGLLCSHSSAPGVHPFLRRSWRTAPEALAAVRQLRRGSCWRGELPAGGAQRQSGSSAPGVQSLPSPCRGSVWTSDSESQGQRSFPPILLNHGRDKTHYESLLVEVPETSDKVLMIHNIIWGAHSFWPRYKI